MKMMVLSAFGFCVLLLWMIGLETVMATESGVHHSDETCRAPNAANVDAAAFVGDDHVVMAEQVEADETRTVSRLVWAKVGDPESKGLSGTMDLSGWTCIDGIEGVVRAFGVAGDELLVATSSSVYRTSVDASADVSKICGHEEWALFDVQAVESDRWVAVGAKRTRAGSDWRPLVVESLFQESQEACTETTEKWVSEDREDRPGAFRQVLSDEKGALILGRHFDEKGTWVSVVLGEKGDQQDKVLLFERPGFLARLMALSTGSQSARLWMVGRERLKGGTMANIVGVVNTPCGQNEDETGVSCEWESFTELSGVEPKLFWSASSESSARFLAGTPDDSEGRTLLFEYGEPVPPAPVDTDAATTIQEIASGRYAGNPLASTGDRFLLGDQRAFFVRNAVLALIPEMVRFDGGKVPLSESFSAFGKGSREIYVEPFFIGVYEVTVGEFRRFQDATSYVTDAEKDSGGRLCRTVGGPDFDLGDGYRPTWERPGFDQENDKHPVVCVSWDDANSYVRWLNSMTGLNFRLPSAAEWMYVRGEMLGEAGEIVGEEWCRYENFASVPRDWPDVPPPGLASSYIKCEVSYSYTAPVGSFEPLSRIHDLMGNVAEWTCSPFLRQGKEEKGQALDDNGSYLMVGDALIGVTRCDLEGDVYVVAGGSYPDPVNQFHPGQSLSGAESRSGATGWLGFRLAREP